MFSSYVASLDINLMRPSLFGWFVTLFHFVFWPLLVVMSCTLYWVFL